MFCYLEVRFLDTFGTGFAETPCFSLEIRSGGLSKAIPGGMAPLSMAQVEPCPGPQPSTGFLFCLLGSAGQGSCCPSLAPSADPLGGQAWGAACAQKGMPAAFPR